VLFLNNRLLFELLLVSLREHVGQIYGVYLNYLLESINFQFFCPKHK